MPSIKWNENQPIANVKWNANLNVQAVYMNGEIAYAKPGTQTFTSSGTFTVPSGITIVTLCMIGAGGSGAYAYGLSKHAGGGHAGQIKSQTYNVSPGQNISVIIGSGGVCPHSAPDEVSSNGQAGGNSSFGSLVAIGGAGAIVDLDENIIHFKGDGETKPANCKGTYINGTYIEFSGDPHWGGEAGFGNGGNAAAGATAGNGGYGAGGGGAKSANSLGTPGNGGNGYCGITWG